MVIFLGFIVFMVIAFFVAMNGNRSPQNFDGTSSGGGVGGFFSGGIWGMRQNGTPARGIMLAVSMTGRRTNYGGQRYEIRSARVDIEPQGYAPYEVSTDVYIPSNLVRDVLPGSTMELRVDLNSRGMVIVIGPDVGYTAGAVRTT